MVALEVAGGMLCGTLLGWIAWLGAQRFAARYRLATDHAVDAGAPPVSRSIPPGLALAATAMGLWGGWVGWQAPGLPVATVALLISALLLCLSLVDYQVHRIPDELVLALVLCATAQSIWLGQPTLAMAALGLAVGGGVFYLLSLPSRGALGMGDVKLEAAIGALLGVPAVLAAMLVGIIAAGLVALLLLITRRAGRKDPLAYGTYLALGAWVMLIQLWNLVNWQL